MNNSMLCDVLDRLYYLYIDTNVLNMIAKIARTVAITSLEPIHKRFIL